MPRIVPDKMIECLLKIHNHLSAIWLECKNNDLCDAIQAEMDYIRRLIEAIETITDSSSHL
jgi:hypothetical protein